jgi:hypothetical protein
MYGGGGGGVGGGGGHEAPQKNPPEPRPNNPKSSQFLIPNIPYVPYFSVFSVALSIFFFTLGGLQSSGPGKRNSVALSVGSADRQTICETIFSADVEPFVVGLHA